MLTAKKNYYRRALDSVLQFSSAIGEHTTICGQFTGGENIMVRGTVKGDSDVKGLIVVMERGCWIGHLVADVVVIAGRVEGNIEAREKIEIAASGHVLGDIRAPIIAMETGAVHEGRLQMPETSRLSQYQEKRFTAQPLPT